MYNVETVSNNIGNTPFTFITRSALESNKKISRSIQNCK